MKRILSFFTLLIFVPLFLALFFMMPIEFLVSSYHLYRAASSIEGRVMESESISHRGNTLSKIRYRFDVAGQSHESTRVRAGWISDESYESGAGDLAGSLKPNSSVWVHYDPWEPGFSLLEYGWPKWSIGFSLAVWGIGFGWLAFPNSESRPRNFLLYGATRGMTLTGMAIIALLPPTIHPAATTSLVSGWLVLACLAACYGWLRYHRSCEPKAGHTGT